MNGTVESVPDWLPKTPATWDLWLDGAQAPARNMAADEALLRTAPRRGRPLLRFYAWDRPTVSIGYVQKAAAAPASGYAVVRRPTGGGVVFHDADFTYSVAIPVGHWLAGLDRTRSYEGINRALAAGLARCRLEPVLATGAIPRTVDRRTMVCFRNPTRYDILLGDRKIAGSAQRRTRTGILHQGSIHFGGPLAVGRTELQTAIRAGFREVLAVQFRNWLPDAAVQTLITRLEEDRYGTAAWNRRR